MKTHLRAPLVMAMAALMLFTACSPAINPGRAAEDTAYLTPIPEETLYAFRQGTPIETRLEAAIAARVALNSPLHFKPVGSPPKLLLLEDMRLEEARKRVAVPGSTSFDTRPGETKVWFAVFEHDYQVTPPGEQPGPIFHGCSYVIINADGSTPGQSIGGFDCEVVRDLLAQP